MRTDIHAVLLESYTDGKVQADLRAGALAVLRGDLDAAAWLAANSPNPHALALTGIKFGAFALVDFLRYDGARKLVLRMDDGTSCFWCGHHPHDRECPICPCVWRGASR